MQSKEGAPKRTLPTLRETTGRIHGEIKTVKRGGLDISFLHEEEFEEVYREIFVDGNYDPFKAKTSNPTIIDAGAHIGLATLFFKSKYPDAQVRCIEPNPLNLALLQKNIEQNDLDDVGVFNGALAGMEGQRNFYTHSANLGQVPWTWGNSLAVNHWALHEPTDVSVVDTVKLSTFLAAPVDLVKLDIEGAEEEVLREVASKSGNIGEILMEFHGSNANPDNSSQRVFSLLDSYGMGYTIRQDGKEIREEEILAEDPHWLLVHAER